jgi:hypothetical protein
MSCGIGALAWRDSNDDVKGLRGRLVLPNNVMWYWGTEWRGPDEGIKSLRGRLVTQKKWMIYKDIHAC